jgi:dienelactone hydrolase
LLAAQLCVPEGRPAGASLALPSPTGPFSVGTRVEYLSDTSRPDTDFPPGRPVTVQLWYPTRAGKGIKARYLIESGLLEMLKREKYYGVDTATLTAWAGLRTHSTLEAPPAGGKHPLVLVSVGLGVIRANYTSIAEELASHGTIVALVESPFQGAMVLPGGREILDTTDRFGEAAGHRRGVAGWSGDLSFVLDMMRGGGLSTGAQLVVASVEWSQVGTAGHSSGGLVAVATCERDSRVRAGINMDGGLVTPDGEPLADFVTKGVTRPTLLLRSRPVYSGEDLARRKLTREEWEKRGEAGNKALLNLAARSGGKLSLAAIVPSGHFTFSDAPFVMPTAINRFGGQILPARQSWTLVTRTLRAYLDGELSGHGGGLAPIAREFPELTLGPPKP